MLYIKYNKHNNLCLNSRVQENDVFIFNFYARNFNQYSVKEYTKNPKLDSFVYLNHFFSKFKFCCEYIITLKKILLIKKKVFLIILKTNIMNKIFK